MTLVSPSSQLNYLVFEAVPAESEYISFALQASCEVSAFFYSPTSFIVQPIKIRET